MDFESGPESKLMCVAGFVSGACPVITRLSSRTGVTAARKKVRAFVTKKKMHSVMALFF